MVGIGKSFVKSWNKGEGSQLSRPLSDGAYRRVVWGTMGMFVVLWFGHIWLNHDMALTFRQILNFTEGYGVVWNWGERVQAFTHPSWLVVLSVVHVLCGGLLNSNLLKFSSTLLSLCLCLGAF